MFRFLAACVGFACSVFAGGLDRYRDLVVEDASDATKQGGVRITYLGTNGYQLETGGRVLLVDPYLTRASLGRVALGLPLRSDPERVHGALVQMAPKAEVIVVTHGHFDHALDLPEVMRRTGARLLAPSTTVKLAALAGAPAEKSRSIYAGQAVRVGPWKITALEARHDCICGWEPFSGEVEHSHGRAPRNAGDWKLGTPLAFLIEGGGQRIYLDSGGRLDGPLPRIGKVDVAIVGVALKDSRARLPALLGALRPRYFLPSHQDDFFRPLDRPFRFGPLTDFPAVRRMHASQRLPGRMVLLDYFRPWTPR
jgi:L-ascorbate metabolism protein UlaG (beta-lactamase superfamily)